MRECKYQIIIWLDAYLNKAWENAQMYWEEIYIWPQKISMNRFLDKQNCPARNTKSVYFNRQQFKLVNRINEVGAQNVTSEVLG